jgi:hypothetical protein
MPQVQAILNASEPVRRACILLAAAPDRDWPAERLLPVIARKRAGLSLEDIEAILPSVVPESRERTGNSKWEAGQRLLPLLAQIEATWAALDEAGRRQLGARLAEVADWIDERNAERRLRALFEPPPVASFGMIPGDDLAGPALRAVLDASREPLAARLALVGLLAQVPVSNGVGWHNPRTRPTRKWHAAARDVADGLSDPAGLTAALLDAAAAALEQPRPVRHVNEAIACGLAVFAGEVARTAGGAELLPRLRRLALLSPRHSTRLGNICVEAIAEAALPSSLTELRRLERATTNGGLLNTADRAIGKLAAAHGTGRDELLEQGVEDHGLSPDGTLAVPLAEGWTAVLAAGARTATVGYLHSDGGSRASLPAAIRRQSGDAVAALQKAAKAARGTIGNERARLEALLASGRALDAARWRELYLGHPVTGQLARALIWELRAPDGQVVTGIPVSESALLTSDGGCAEAPGEAGARLWHPASADAGEVRAWRALLLDRSAAQPVKQAFREVYVVTLAEEGARDHSQRFGGHIFRQARARALFKGRGWAVRPLAEYDEGNGARVARRPFEHAGLRAEFAFDAFMPRRTGFGDLYPYCASRQVRFVPLAGGAPVPLGKVPPLVFSEAMRDIDLVIGVSSIGALSEWLDQPDDERFGEDYWHRFGFGELGAAAGVRREVLASLVPRLAIAARCTLQERFLVVRGDHRTYKIHLGSGNVLMSPGDRYLCIVAAPGTQAGKVFLPFDDDPVLSLILSKAFLLAADAKITDPSIARQIWGT